MMICSKCGQEHERRGQKYCLRCHAAYMRAWRKPLYKNDLERRRARAFRERRSSDKQICRALAKMAVKRGKLIKQSCERCGDPQSQMHHPDYGKPLLVIWLCRKCHLSLHREERNERVMDSAGDVRDSVDRPGTVSVRRRDWRANQKRDQRSPSATRVGANR